MTNTKDAREFWTVETVDRWRAFASKDKAIYAMKSCGFTDMEIEQELTHVIEYSAFESLQKELEKLRMQLAACGVAAMCNTQETKEINHIDRDNEAWSASYADVCQAVEREIILREELSRLQGEIREAVDNYIFNPCERCPGFDCSGCDRAEKYNMWIERNKGE